MSVTRHRGLTEPAADAAIDAACRNLRLPTMRSQFSELADAAARDQMTYRGFLAELLMAECDDRNRRRSERRIKAAGFPREKALRTPALRGHRRPPHLRRQHHRDWQRLLPARAHPRPRRTAADRELTTTQLGLREQPQGSRIPDYPFARRRSQTPTDPETGPSRRRRLSAPMLKLLLFTPHRVHHLGHRRIRPRATRTGRPVSGQGVPATYRASGEPR